MVLGTGIIPVCQASWSDQVIRRSGDDLMTDQAK